MVAHGAALGLKQEVEDEVDAVVQQQQVLRLQVGHTLRRRQLPLPHLRVIRRTASDGAFLAPSSMDPGSIAIALRCCICTDIIVIIAYAIILAYYLIAGIPCAIFAIYEYKPYGLPQKHKPRLQIYPSSCAAHAAGCRVVSTIISMRDRGS